MIVIVGAGIAGLSLAHALQQRGASVTLVEAGDVAGGASGVATAYLEPRLGHTPMRQLEWAGLEAWPAYAAALEQESGQSVSLRMEGQVRATTADNLEKFENDLERRRGEGWKVRSLAPEEWRSMEPALGKAVAAAAHVPAVAWVDGAAVCRGLAHTIRQKGGTILTGHRVTALEPLDRGIRLKMHNGSTVEGELVVLCCAMGSNHIEGCPGDMGVSHPVRGVNLVLDQSRVQNPIRHLVKHHRGTLCPRPWGELLVGTTYERDVETLDVEADIVERLYAHAEPIVPDVRTWPLKRVTAGLRTKIGDGTLRAGPSKESSRIWFSLSHAGAGFLRAPVVADDLARRMMEG